MLIKLRYINWLDAEPADAIIGTTKGIAGLSGSSAALPERQQQ